MAKIEPKVDPSNAVRGMEIIAANAGNIKNLVGGIALGFAGWKISETLFSNLVTTERQLIQLKTALQDSTAGVQDYKEAMKFAARTPFPVEQVTQAAVMLRVFQFNPFDKVEAGGRDLMEMLGDMAGAMGRDIPLAAHALNRAMVGEWEIMQNNFQISAKQIPGLKNLASGTKEYGEAIVKHLATLDRFRGGMDMTAKSVVGLISNIEDAGTIFKTYTTGVVDAEDTLKGLTFYDSMRDNLQTMYNTFTDPAPIRGLRAMSANLAKLKEELVKKTTSEKRSIEIQQKIATIQKEYNRLGGSSIDTIKRWERSINAAGLSTKDWREQMNYLLMTGQANTNELLSQSEKVQNAGRLTGLGLKFMYEFGLAPLTNGMSKMVNSLLDLPQKFLNGIIPIESFSKSAKKSVGIATDDIKGFTEATDRYMSLMARNGGSQADEMAKEIRQSLLANQDIMTKQVMIFAILVKFAILFLKMELERFFTQNAIGIFLKAAFELLWELIVSVGDIVGDILGEIFSSVGDLLGAFLDLFDLGSEGGAEFASVLEVISDAVLNAVDGFAIAFKWLTNWLNPIRAVKLAFNAIVGVVEGLIGLMAKMVGGIMKIGGSLFGKDDAGAGVTDFGKFMYNRGNERLKEGVSGYVNPADVVNEKLNRRYERKFNMPASEAMKVFNADGVDPKTKEAAMKLYGKGGSGFQSAGIGTMRELDKMYRAEKARQDATSYQPWAGGMSSRELGAKQRASMGAQIPGTQPSGAVVTPNLASGGGYSSINPNLAGVNPKGAGTGGTDLKKEVKVIVELKVPNQQVASAVNASANNISTSIINSLASLRGLT